jgi:serine/threonine protein kinase/Flp pilus assembly protein TadD
MPADGPRPEGAAPREIAAYRIVRELGAGGMGTVYEAYDSRMNRSVALKILSRHLSASEKAGVRFAQEAWIGGRLNHPNLVKVYERGEWQELSFYSMELVSGGSLHDVIRAMWSEGRDERLGLEFGTREYITWAIGQIIAAARGLDYAHRQGVIHRDIKPMNLLLARDPDVVKVADFGLAVDVEGTRLTTVGKMLGTIAYMAPEQIRGRQDDLDARTDVYALGVTLFELLTLELPYAGESQQLYMNAVMTSEHKRLTRLNKRVGRDLEIVLNRALEKSPKDRYRSAAELADDLENVLHFRPIRARPPSPPVKLLKWVRRKPLQAALAATLIVGVPVVSWLSYRFVQQRTILSGIQREQLRDEARRLMHDRRYARAIVSLDAILLGDPSDDDALVKRAFSLTFLADRQEKEGRRSELQERALADISRVIDLVPSASWPYRVRAFLQDKFGNSEAARADEELSRAYRTSSPDPVELEIEAHLAFQEGDMREAIEKYSTVIEKNPDAIGARSGRAEAYEESGDRIRARTDWEVVAALRPSDFFPHYALARMLTRSGKLEEGEARYRKAATIAPGNAYVPEALSENLLGQAERRAGEEKTDAALARFREAESEARRALELDPELPWAHMNLGASLVGMSRLMKGPSITLIDQAMEHYDRALALWKESGIDSGPRGTGQAYALVNKCDALIELGDSERALPACRDVIGLLPDDPDSFYNLAGAYALANRPDDALAALEKDLELGDTDHQYLATDPWFEILREDPRFRSLLTRMKEAAARSAGG